MSTTTESSALDDNRSNHALTSLLAELVQQGWPRLEPRAGDGAVDLSQRPAGCGAWVLDPDGYDEGPRMLTIHMPRSGSVDLAASIEVEDHGLAELTVWQHALEDDGEPVDLAWLPRTPTGLAVLRQLVAAVAAAIAATEAG